MIFGDFKIFVGGGSLVGGCRRCIEGAYVPLSIVLVGEYDVVPDFENRVSLFGIAQISDLLSENMSEKELEVCCLLQAEIGHSMQFG